MTSVDAGPVSPATGGPLRRLQRSLLDGGVADSGCPDATVVGVKPGGERRSVPMQEKTSQLGLITTRHTTWDGQGLENSSHEGNFQPRRQSGLCRYSRLYYLASTENVPLCRQASGELAVLRPVLRGSPASWGPGCWRGSVPGSRNDRRDGRGCSAGLWASRGPNAACLPPGESVD